MLKFEYDDVVAWHPYRTYQPWDHGGVRVLHVDGVNGHGPDPERVRRDIADVEGRLLNDCVLAGIRAQPDNHYGFTVRVDHERMGLRDPMYYQLRFSDGSLYVWLMPGPPA